MIYKDLHKFIKAVKARAYNLEVRFNKKKLSVYISVFFVKNSIKFLVFENENRFVLTELKNKVRIQTPDIVKVELKREHKLEIFKLILNQNISEHTINDKEINENNKRIDISNGRLDESYEPHKAEQTNSQLIERLVDKALEDARKERECNDALRMLNETNELVKQQSLNIEELEHQLSLKAEEIKELEKIITNKSNIEHYALLAGDIASKIGFDKEKLKNIFSGVKTDDKANETYDDSGIIEDDTS